MRCFVENRGRASFRSALAAIIISEIFLKINYQFIKIFDFCHPGASLVFFEVKLFVYYFMRAFSMRALLVWIRLIKTQPHQHFDNY